ncbi:hypothetical protein [Brevundimonas sp.]|jgi:hypothetical protein|uniref:hypothetical protein n=1 Tax=Brevundimonas sp. TaxID=1871086 RepID=UPI002E0F4A81|nr:hypothetical protein [Brevundimonas sp.]
MDALVRRRRLVIAAGAAVVALGLAAGATLIVGPTETQARGPGLKIAVVTPPAPAIEPGGVMEVGQLTDGYRHVPPPAPQPIEWVETEPGWWDAPSDPDDLWIEPRSPAPAVVVTAVETPERRDSMGFGFEPVAASDRRVMRSAPPERRPDEGEGRRPEIVPVSGERGAVFY